MGGGVGMGLNLISQPSVLPVLIDRHGEKEREGCLQHRGINNDNKHTICLMGTCQHEKHLSVVKINPF